MCRRDRRFGWPPLAHVVLLFLVFQGERLIVGRELGMATLAIFSMGLTLTLTPTLVLAKSAQNFFLPQLASEPDVATFTKLANISFQLHLLFGGLLVTGTALLGNLAVTVLLGQKYAGLMPVLVWLAISQGIRIGKGGPSTVALALGRTENALAANVIRVALLPVAWWLIARGADMVHLVQILSLIHI